MSDDLKCSMTFLPKATQATVWHAPRFLYAYLTKCDHAIKDHAATGGCSLCECENLTLRTPKDQRRYKSRKK